MFTSNVGILGKSEGSALYNSQEKDTTQNYAPLAKVILAQIIVFNRRHAGRWEISKMCLKHFNENDSTIFHEDIAMG